MSCVTSDKHEVNGSWPLSAASGSQTKPTPESNERPGLAIHKKDEVRECKGQNHENEQSRTAAEARRHGPRSHSVDRRLRDGRPDVRASTAQPGRWSRTASALLQQVPELRRPSDRRRNGMAAIVTMYASFGVAMEACWATLRLDWPDRATSISQVVASLITASTL